MKFGCHLEHLLSPILRFVRELGVELADLSPDHLNAIDGRIPHVQFLILTQLIEFQQ